MNGSPPSSSVRPGASPTIIRTGSLGPVPTTTRWRVSPSRQLVHVGSSRGPRPSRVTRRSRAAPAPRRRKGSPTRSCRPAPPTPRRVISSSPWRPSRTTSSPGRDLVVAAVDQQLVHRHRAGQRVAPAVDEDLGAGVEQPARVAVGVAEGDGGHRAIARQRTAPPVAGPLAGARRGATRRRWARSVSAGAQAHPARPPRRSTRRAGTRRGRGPTRAIDRRDSG